MERMVTMHTVEEYAQELAFLLMDELPEDDDSRRDELLYNGMVAALWEVIVIDFDWYIFHHYTAGHVVWDHKTEIRRLLEERPIRQGVIQDCFERYIPAYERHVQKAIPALEPGWRQWLGIGGEEAEGA